MNVGGIALGLLIAFIAQTLAIFLAGAGHGWVTPFHASLLLWVASPIAFALAWPSPVVARRTLLLLIVIALLADAWLIKSSIDEDNALPFYLEINGVAGFLIMGAWIGCWALWQAIAIRALFVDQKAS